MNTGEHAWVIPTGETPARVQEVIDENNLNVYGEVSVVKQATNQINN